MEETNLLEEISKNVVQGRTTRNDPGFDEGFEGEPAVKELVEEALEAEVDPGLLIKALTEGMKVVGERFEAEEYFLPDMLASAEAVGVAMEILAPRLKQAGTEKRGKVVIATVKGDQHDIGKNIVSIVLQGSGFEVIDLGIDVSEDGIVRAVREENPDVVGLSALLTNTMVAMKETIEALEREGIRSSVKVIVGGAPISTEFAQEIGADGYAPDAFKCQQLIEKLLQES